MQALTVQKLTVKCDEPDCNWNEEVTLKKALTYHNKSCPKCGKDVIVNDEENSMLVTLQTLENIEVPNSEKSIKIQIDSFGLR